MKILQVCSYNSPYEGNFIKSLFALESALKEKGHRVLYAFPGSAAETAWCKELQKRTKVFFLPYKNSRLNSKAVPILKAAVNSESIDIIHSHFELYDIACKKAAGRNTKVFWHLHDHIVKARRPDKNLVVKLQYAHYGRGVTLLSVCEHYKNVAVGMGFDPVSAKTVVNGIDLDRITYPYPDKNPQYDFITFGWDFYRKGVDLIFTVLQRLAAEGYTFRFLLNCSEDTHPDIDRFFEGKLPSWLQIGGQVEDVNALFSESAAFIQASRLETFCYAACEAAYAGMDVISSDIPGLEWAHNVPTVTFFERENTDQLYTLLKQRLDGKFALEPSAVDESRRVIEENYSVNVWVKHIVEEYGL